MENFKFFAAAYIAFTLVFFVYVAKLQSKISSLQKQIDQLKNK
jgi:type VI protein secretion system component VasF